MFNLLAEAVSVTIPTPDLAAVPAWGWAGGGAAIWYALMAVMFRRSWSERIIRHETGRSLRDITSGDYGMVALYYVLSPVFIPIIGLGKGLASVLVKQPKPSKETKA